MSIRRSQALIACALAAFAFILPAILRGEGIFPTALLSMLPPWRGRLQGRLVDPLLADQALQFWPWRLFLWSELRAGRLPGWNPFSAAGVPFAGCVQAAPFFPLEWLGALTGPLAFSLLAAFCKIFVAGFGAACHALQLGAKKNGATLAGVSFGLCGFIIAWLGHPHTNAACLLPWLFVSLHRATRDQSWRSWAPAALVIGLILLAGHPPTELHVLLAGAVYALVRSRGQLKRTLLRGSAAALTGAALAAPALLPFLEFYAQSSAPAASQLLARSSVHLPPWELLFLLLPKAGGVLKLGLENNFLERAAFVGMPSLALAGLAWNKSRFHLVLALFGLSAALGLPPLPWIFRALPILSAANPSRLLLLFCFGASVLAGLAAGQSRRATLGFALVAAAALATAAGVHAPLPILLEGAAEAAAAVALLAMPRLRPLAPVAAAGALLFQGFGINQTAPVQWLYPETPATAALRAEQGEGRIFAFSPALAPDTALPLGLRDVRGRDFMSLRRYEELLTGRAGDFLFYGRADRLPEAPGLLAISAIAGPVAPRGWKRVLEGDPGVFAAPEKPSRALFVPRAAVSAEVLRAVQSPGFNPTRQLIFDDGGTVSGGSATGSARIAGESTNEVEVEVDSSGPGFLLLLDNWYPGWQAEVNGIEAKVRRADYTFRAVAIPGGHGKVRFRYRPASLTAGLWLAFLALLLLSASAFPSAARAPATAPWRPPTPPDRS